MESTASEKAAQPRTRCTGGKMSSMCNADHRPVLATRHTSAPADYLYATSTFNSDCRTPGSSCRLHVVADTQHSAYGRHSGHVSRWNATVVLKRGTASP